MAASRLPFEQPALLFDGDCGFCESWVIRLKRWDRRGRIHFLPLSTPGVRTFLEAHVQAGATQPLGDSAHWVAGNRIFMESEAIRRALLFLGGRWMVLAWILSLIPRAWRDAIYRRIARNRYRLSGGTCAVRSR